MGGVLGERGGYGGGLMQWSCSHASIHRAVATIQPITALTLRLPKPSQLQGLSRRRSVDRTVQHSIQLSLSLVGTAALVLASMPVAVSPAAAEPSKVAQGKATDLGVMSVSLKDVVKLNYGLQGQLQGAGR